MRQILRNISTSISGRQGVRASVRLIGIQETQGEYQAEDELLFQRHRHAEDDGYR